MKRVIILLVSVGVCFALALAHREHSETMYTITGLDSSLMAGANDSHIPKPITHKREGGGKRNDSTSDPDYLGLMAWYAMVPNAATARVGFIDDAKRKFYAWKGINMEPSETINFDNISGLTPEDISGYQVIEIEPPISYLQLEKESFAVGYFARPNKVFWRWKVKPLSRGEIPDSVSNKQILKPSDVQISESIRIPDHHQHHPKSWKKEQ